MTKHKAATPSPVLRVLIVMAFAVIAAKECPAQVSLGVRPPPVAASAVQLPAQPASKVALALLQPPPSQAAEQGRPIAEAQRSSPQPAPSAVAPSAAAASAPSLRALPSASDGAPMSGLRIADLARVQAAELQADAAKRLAAVATPKAAQPGASSPTSNGGAGEVRPAKSSIFTQAPAPKPAPQLAQLLGIQGPLGAELAEVREPSGRIGTFRPGARIGDWEVKSVTPTSVTVQRASPPSKAKRPSTKRSTKSSDSAAEVRQVAVGSTF